MTLLRKVRHLVVLAVVMASLLTLSSTAAANAACLLPTTFTSTVTGVVNGRTLKLDDDTELRLASILGPTSYDSPSAPDRWPAETASINALTKRVLGQNVAISLERSGRDRYGRRVGSGLLVDAARGAATSVKYSWLQALAVRAGEARVALTASIDEPCAALLLRLEAEAAADQRGLWKLALYKTKRADKPSHLLRYRSTFQIVEGTITRVAPGRSAVYLNFGTNWKLDFTAKFSRSALKRANISPGALKRIEKRVVRVRGWIEKRNGPLITVWRPEQIELLARSASGDVHRRTPPRLLTALRPADPVPNQ